MDPRTHAEFGYRIDRDDRIVSVDVPWLAFARENDLSDLDEAAVLGRPVLAFISDAETRHLYELAFARVRATGRGIVLPFRCDSPTLRRYMELDISALSDAGLSLVGRLLWIEERPHVALLDVTTPRTRASLVICSWCKRVRMPDGWREVEHAVAQLRLFDSALLPQLTHGICEACRDRVLGALAQANVSER